MKRQITLTAMLIVTVCSLFSCGRKSDPLLNVNEVKAISLVGDNGDVRATLAESDKLEIAKYISLLEYDARLNDSGAALRMTAADYTLVLSYKTPGATDEHVQIWISSGRTLLRDQFYTFRAGDLPKATAILKKY